MLRQHQILLISWACCLTFVQGHSAVHDAESCGVESSSQCSKDHADDLSLDKTAQSTTAESIIRDEKETADPVEDTESADEEFDESPVELEDLPEVEELLNVEKAMLHFMSQYIQNETQRLQILSRNLRHWMEVSNYSMADPEEYLSVYLNCFHLLKRMAFDIESDLLRFSLHDTQLSEQELNQWDYLSHEHYLLKFANETPIALDQLPQLDTMGILTILNSNPDLYTAESTRATQILKDSLRRPLEFSGTLYHREELTDGIDTYVEHLESIGQKDLSADFLAAAELVYPTQEEPEGILMES